MEFFEIKFDESLIGAEDGSYYRDGSFFPCNKDTRSDSTLTTGHIPIVVKSGSSVKNGSASNSYSLKSTGLFKKIR